MKYWKLIKDLCDKLPRLKPGFKSEEQCCAAAVFILLVLFAAAYPKNLVSAQPADRKQISSAAFNIEEIVHITAVLEEEKEKAAAPMPEPEEVEERPSAVKLNLAGVFPEGADTSDVWNSYAGSVYKDLISKDSQWLSQIFKYSKDAPAKVASDLKLSRSSVLGKYRQDEEGHDPNREETWTIPKFEKTNYSFTDGSGNEVNAYSNAKEILTLSSIYAFYQKENQAEALKQHAENLWNQSHHVKLSMGKVYYCNGKLDEKIDESQEPEESAETQPVETVSQETQPETQSAEASPESAVATSSDAAANESYPEEISKQIEGIFGSNREIMTKQLSETAAENAVSKQQGCPGHIDLNISVSIAGIEGKRGLIAMDDIGNALPVAAEAETDVSVEAAGWNGWDEYNRAYAGYLFQVDWADTYGLFPSDVAIINPLSASEVTRYLNDLPEGTSQERKDIIEYALTSVGRIPYYWGGKPSAPDYDVNVFGTAVSPDYKGRALKGLDCSGWINWVYWSVTGSKPAAEGTGSLSSYGRGIPKEELKPGDIMVRLSDTSHVVMFLGWEADGSMKCIHESSTGSGNVIISTKEANGTTYRNLLD